MESYREFTCPDMVEEWGDRIYGKWTEYYKNQKALLNQSAGGEIDEMLIEGYCGNDFRHINNYLRFGENSVYEAEYTSLLSKRLTVVMSLAPRIPENIIVYRSVGNHTAEALKKYGKALEKAFISTSMLKTIAMDSDFYSNPPYLLKAYVKKGTRGIYTTSIAFGGEYEMLLSRDGVFKLLKEPYGADGKLVFECQITY